MIPLAAFLLAWFFLHALFQPFSIGAGLNSDQLSGLRLTQAFSLLHGLKYPSVDEGILLAPMYGPVGFCFYWPAALFTLPSNAMLAAQSIAAACFLVPALLIFIAKTGRHSMREGILAFLAFGLLSCTADALRSCALWVHADAPALGLAMTAAGLLYSGASEDRRGIFSALCAVLSVWAKQVMLPIVPALLLFVLLAHGRRAAVRYAAYLLLSGIAVTSLVLYFFGIRDIWLNMVIVPIQSRWISDDKWQAGLIVFRHLFLANALPGLLLLLALWRDLKAGAFKRGFSFWLASNPWSVFVFVGIFLLPASFLGKIKIGSAMNNLGLSVCFLLIASLLAWVHRRGASVLILGALMVLTGVQNFPALSQNPIAPNPKRFVADTAWRFAVEHPGEVYFPGIPLATAMAQKKYYHARAGIWERQVSGFQVTPSHFKAGLPPRMKWVVLGPPDWFIPYDVGFMERFPGWSERSHSELPGWTVFSEGLS